jgi:peptide/nickel transport system ATP-binding protein
VVRHISDRVLVMYLGKIVEVGTRDTLYERPMHPYTRALMSAVPIPEPDGSALAADPAQGDVPSPHRTRRRGCHFRTRCWKPPSVCAVDVPRFSGDPDHTYACHHPIETPVELGDAPLPV